MAVVLVLAAILGSSATFGVLWPYGAALAFVCAPFGGSLFAIAAAGLIALRNSGRDESFDLELDRRTDEMVAALGAAKKGAGASISDSRVASPASPRDKAA